MSGRGRDTWLIPLLAAVILVGPATTASAYPRPGEVRRISVGPDGREALPGFSYRPAITPDGRFIAFETVAENLVADDDNEFIDIFVADRLTGGLERVSLNSSGEQADWHANEASVSADGRYVAFTSAGNFGPEITFPIGHIFVRDRQARTTELVSRAIDGSPANGSSNHSSMSADGRHIVFQSLATDMAVGGTGGKSQIYVRDLDSDVTRLISVGPGGTPGNDHSTDGRISGDGRYVVYSSRANNLSPRLQDEHVKDNTWQSYVHDLETSSTERVSVASDGTPANSDSWLASINGDGRFVAFSSKASNLVPTDGNSFRDPEEEDDITGFDTRGNQDVFIHDREMGTTRRVSVASDGGEANGNSQNPTISPDGRSVSFYSTATNLASGNHNDAWDIFLRDMETHTTEIVTLSTEGAPTSGTSPDSRLLADRRFRAPMSNGAIHVAFPSQAVDLVPGDTNHNPFGRFLGCGANVFDCGSDIFLRHRGPRVGVVRLESSRAGNSVSVSGSARFIGAVITSSSDDPADAPDGGPVGAELTRAEIIHRPEDEDLLLKIEIDHLPRSRSPVLPTQGTGGSGGGELIPQIGGAPGVVYVARFSVGAATFEMRAHRAPSGPEFRLYRCSGDTPSAVGGCESLGELRGGFGTTGDEVVTSLRLAEIGIHDDDILEGIAVFSAVGHADAGALRILDEVPLEDSNVTNPVVELGIAPTGTPESELAFDAEAELADGNFSGTLDISSFAAGDYEVWARACIGETCGSASEPVDLAAGASPSPTASPTPDPTESPPPEATAVSFTEHSATSGQFSDRTLFEARLTDSDGGPIKDAELVFELTGEESSRTFTAVTKGDGVASVTQTLDERPGPHQLTVRYAGDDAHPAAADTAAFVVDKEDTTLELTVLGKDNTLRARLSDQDRGSQRIAGRTIDFYADSDFIGSATTDDSGVATFEPPPQHRDGKHEFEARFEGDDFFGASRDPS